nr:MAG TPA: hypothetical protein [Caudoviricetes sp.]
MTIISTFESLFSKVLFSCYFSGNSYIKDLENNGI